jgi:hypothetical protein
MKKVLLAAVLGGLAMFLWASVSHLALGLGDVGIKEMPNETAVLAAMRGNLPEPGFYLFPGLGVSRNAPPEQLKPAMHVFNQKYEAGPYGMLIYHPTGRKPISVADLGTEFGTNVLQAFLLALLVMIAAASLNTFGKRVGFITVVGLVAALTTNVSYWNWYGFPTSYTLASMLDRVLGYIAAGVVIALIMRQRAEETVAAKA